MKPESSVKLRLDLEYVKKLQAELPGKLQIILVSIIQFLVGSFILSKSIYMSHEEINPIFVTLLMMLGIFVILFSAYTFTGYILRKRYILLIETLLSKNQVEESA